MAYIYYTGSITNGYSVSVSRAVGAKEVGSGKLAENLPTDMMLIHFLLWAIYCRTSFVPPNLAIKKIILDIDKTKTWNSLQTKQLLSQAILLYQKDRNKRPFSKVYADGRIDVIMTGSGITPISKTKYTILGLIFDYMDPHPMFDRANQDIRPLLKSETKLPFPLRLELFGTEF